MQEIADYSLQFPVVVLTYYRLTGDRATAAFAANTVYKDLFEYFAEFENEKGLLAGIDKKNAKWVLVDWPENLRDGYDYAYALKKGNTVLTPSITGDSEPQRNCKPCWEKTAALMPKKRIAWRTLLPNTSWTLKPGCTGMRRAPIIVPSMPTRCRWPSV